MFNKIKALSGEGLGKARELSSKAVSSAGESASLARSKGAEAMQATTEKGGALIDKYWPAIEKVLVDGLLSVASDKLNDERMVEEVFNKAYEILPVFVRLALSRERCLAFAMQHKEPILAKVEAARLKREATQGGIGFSEPLRLESAEELERKLDSQ